MAIQIGLLGAGRIGKVHADAVADSGIAALSAVFDPIADAAGAVAESTGARIASIDEILGNPAIEAVIIATPTDLHADQIEAAARAGKAIFCEKPIDLDLQRVRACLDVVEAEETLLMVGFNRRFDPHIAELKNRVVQGAIGEAELVEIISRDPAPPPVGYVERSGGIFRDMMIHDFDVARFLLDEEIAEVSAMGSALIDAGIGKAGDFDTAAATLKSVSGKVCVITNSRRATYGYDQRIEVHGSKGMAAVGNPRATSVTVADSDGYRVEPLLPFFVERYHQAYRRELSAFLNALDGSDAPIPRGIDGLKALELADAADRSARNAEKIKLA